MFEQENGSSAGRQIKSVDKDLGNAYDDYEGQVKCFTCGALLEIKTDQGAIKAVQLVKSKYRSLNQETVESLV